MKPFDRIFRPGAASALLMWLYPILLAIPNIALAVTEQDPILVKCADIALPLGIYYIIFSLARRVGLLVWLCLPLTFFSAFQIVLLFLYGESIIAVDMYLNVLTTNTSEAGELLLSLWPALLVVFVLYILPLVWASVLLVRRSRLPQGRRRAPHIIGIVLTITGVSLCVAAPGFSLRRDIFPVNVIDNMFTAISRDRATRAYHTTSARFSHHARCTRPDSLREIYVLVVGETSRAGNWQLLGYDRPTNPRLSRRAGIITYPRTLSQSNTTHKSVPLALSHLTAESFGDSNYSTRGIADAFAEAGFHTAWLSTQARNHSFIDFFAAESDTLVMLDDDHRHHYDAELIPLLDSFIHAHPSGKLMIVLHTYGGHFNYRDRYTPDHIRFRPEDFTKASSDERPRLLNAYDNTILYTDAMLDSVISVLEAQRCPAAMLYFADHGEDIYDDSRRRFLHASPTPTYYQLHVPLLTWTSPELDSIDQNLRTSLAAASRQPVASSASVFPTMLMLAGIESPYLDRSLSLASDTYTPHEWLYLNDYNDGVPLAEAGLRAPDWQRLASIFPDILTHN